MATALESAPVVFDAEFEGGSLGRVERLGETEFRVHVAGQVDEKGRNRQASWYFFRLSGGGHRDIKLTLTDFVGEYNNTPGACPMNADTIPVFSLDGQTWKHFPTMEWDQQRKEATLRIQPVTEPIWIAHVPPYAPSRLTRLLEEIGRHPHARVEVIGKSLQGRDLRLVTVTSPVIPRSRKKNVWLIARQHAWEAGTSFVLEGALRFLTSDTPNATALRERLVFQLVPTMDPDGCAGGQVRFNAKGYDLNRHWDEVAPREKKDLERMPEIWCVKNAIWSHLDSGLTIDLMLSLHNTESGEFIETEAQDEQIKRRLERLHDTLAASTSFDPSSRPTVSSRPSGTIDCLWRERRVPVFLMEQRIGTSPKLGRRPTTADRLTFGEQLIQVMAKTLLEPDQEHR